MTKFSVILGRGENVLLSIAIPPMPILYCLSIWNPLVHEINRGYGSANPLWWQRDCGPRSRVTGQLVLRQWKDIEIDTNSARTFLRFRTSIRAPPGDLRIFLQFIHHCLAQFFQFIL